MVLFHFIPRLLVEVIVSEPMLRVPAEAGAYKNRPEEPIETPELLAILAENNSLRRPLLIVVGP
jgi:hypothetical protein